MSKILFTSLDETYGLNSPQSGFFTTSSNSWEGDVVSTSMYWADQAKQSADAAAFSAAEAAASKASADVAKVAAQGSEDAAAATYVNITNTYLGPHDTPPTETANGVPVSDGMLYYNTVAGQIEVYDSDIPGWENLTATSGVDKIVPGTNIAVTSGGVGIVTVDFVNDSNFVDASGAAAEAPIQSVTASTAADNNITVDDTDGAVTLFTDGEASQLKKTTEESFQFNTTTLIDKTGWRLLREPNSFYGPIGIDASDFSSTPVASNTSHPYGATGDYSFCEGLTTRASGQYAHAEGCQTQALYSCAHAEGFGTAAYGVNASHAEGYSTTASGANGSHAEGKNTTASGKASHAEGGDTIANSSYSHAEGNGCNAVRTYQHAEGAFNKQGINGTPNEGIGSTSTFHETGIGKDDDNRANGFEVHDSGQVVAPELSIAAISTPGTDSNNYDGRVFDGNADRILVTKEWVEASAATQGGNNNWTGTNNFSSTLKQNNNDVLTTANLATENTWTNTNTYRTTGSKSPFTIWAQGVNSGSITPQNLLEIASGGSSVSDGRCFHISGGDNPGMIYGAGGQFDSTGYLPFSAQQSSTDTSNPAARFQTLNTSGSGPITEWVTGTGATYDDVANVGLDGTFNTTSAVGLKADGVPVLLDTLRTDLITQVTASSDFATLKANLLTALGA